MSHAGQCLNTARLVLAHVRAYLDTGQYGECRDSEQACLQTCRHGSIRHIQVYLSQTPPKSSRFAPVVLRTFNFVGIAPEKVNSHFVRASFFLERDKFNVFYFLHTYLYIQEYLTIYPTKYMPQIHIEQIYIYKITNIYTQIF